MTTTTLSPSDLTMIREHACALGKSDRLADVTRSGLELADATVPCLAPHYHLHTDPLRTLALQAWGDAYRHARNETDRLAPLIYPKTTTLLCYVGDATYRVLAYDRTQESLGAYVERLEATPDEWPGWGQRRKGEPDVASHGLYELQLMQLEDGWHMTGWSRLKVLEVAQAAIGTWQPVTVPAREVARRSASRA